MIAVTGASGWIGQHVVRSLCKAGKAVRAIDADPFPGELPKEAVYEKANLAVENQALAKIKGCDRVIHLAATANADAMLDHPLAGIKTNIMTTSAVLEAARQADVERVVFVSTDWVYATSAIARATEELAMPLDTGHLYTTTKLAGEMLCHDYWRHFKLPFTIVRLGSVYGSGMRQEQAIARFIDQALAGEPLTVHNAAHARQYVYVDDVARALMLAAFDTVVGRTYNVAGPEIWTNMMAAHAVVVALGLDLHTYPIEQSKGRTADFDSKHASIAKAKACLQWEPRIGFEEGLARTIEWYKNADL
jgi:UDP-glucose 4-epimerase